MAWAVGIQKKNWVVGGRGGGTHAFFKVNWKENAIQWYSQSAIWKKVAAVHITTIPCKLNTANRHIMTNSPISIY